MDGPADHRCPDRSFTERLKDPQGVHEASKDIRLLLAKLDALVNIAEADLLSYYNHKAKQFVRLTSEARLTEPRASATSNTGAILSLEGPPRTQGRWLDHREDVLKVLPNLTRTSDGLPLDNTFVNPRIAVAMQSLQPSLADTVPAEAKVLKQPWYQALLDNMGKYRGVAVEPLNHEAHPHPQGLRI